MKFNFSGRVLKHVDNSRKLEEMIKHALYRFYPVEGKANLGAISEHFNSIVSYCGMAFDNKSNNIALWSRYQTDSLFACSNVTMEELKAKAKGGSLKKFQLEAV